MSPSLLTPPIPAEVNLTGRPGRIVRPRLSCYNCHRNDRLIKYSPTLKLDLCRDCAIELEKQHRRQHPELYLIYCNVPKEIADRSFDNYTGNKNLIKALQDHIITKPFQSLVLTGICGSGKTHLAISLMRYLIQHNISLNKLYFLEFPVLLNEVRHSYNPNSRASEYEIIQPYKTYPLLVLDDVGYNEGDGKIASEFTCRILGDLARGWDFDKQKYIVTTNLEDNAELRTVFGERIASRMAKAEYIKIDMPDYRKNIPALTTDDN